MNNAKTIVIGAGLAGLTTAYLLQKKGIDVLVLEANDTVGGRIKTITGSTGVTVELGATWFGRQHPTLMQFLDELGLPTFRQHTKGISLFETMSFVPPQKFEIPDSDEPSYRLVGGSSQLIQKLVKKIGSNAIQTNTQITLITEKADQLEVTDASGTIYTAATVIMTLAPNLAINTINYQPNLPKPLVELANATHTWMGESIKFSVEYATPFWKDNQFSGALFSHVGIITEMYDHSSFDNNHFALKGFLNGGTYVLTPEEREAKVIKQLSQCFGVAAENYVAYHEKVWREEPLAFFPYEDLVMGHQNNGDPMYQESYLNNKLFFASSETATENPGYMDGAIVAAQTVTSKIK
ncbi:hypothetical protein FFWV33_05885 [Flavobacterium faecale]|uniref:Amine oxidase domain-containing protein n=1 Tax=Flavobacterium faecale TaxID=1355330 RepID=A0A2S1LC17_9FLAO|nr:NAD(P)/FAD-dependent oxidoreductase [Flavobacterium faecale]AWG21096.1 hypothetical protein FFWV33_05885 [Flavobacterium faecale]